MNSQELEARAKAAEESLGKLEEQYRQQSEENRQTIETIQRENSEMMASLSFAVQEMRTQLFKELEKNRVEQDQRMAEAERRNAELEEKIREEHLRRNNLDQAAKGAAQAAIDEAGQAVSRLDTLPCYFFAPGQAGILHSQLNVCGDLMKQQVWQAALALANATETSADILSEQVKQLFREWQRMMALLKKRTDGLSAECRDFCAEIMEEYTQPLSDEEREFWSGGLWLSHMTKVRGIEDSVNGIDMAHPKNENMRTAFLNQRLSKVGEVQDEQKALIETIRAESTLSARREKAGLQMIESIEESGFSLVEEGFYDNDLRNSYLLKVSIGVNDDRLLLIDIYPVRKNGIAVSNEILLYAEDEVFSHENKNALLNSLLRAVQAADSGLAIHVESEDGQAENNRQMMQPRPEENIRRHMRRYY